MGLKANKRAPATFEDSNGPPPDVFNLAYLVYFSLGVGEFLLLNSFVTAVDCFDYLYPNIHIDRVFTVSNIFPCSIVLLFLTFYGQRYAARIRVNGGLFLFLVSIILMVFLDYMSIKEAGRGSAGTFCATMAALIITGFADGLVQAI